MVDLQCCVHFCCTTKWLRYIYISIYSFPYSFPLWLITGCWIQIPVLYSRTLLFICCLSSLLISRNQLWGSLVFSVIPCLESPPTRGALPFLLSLCLSSPSDSTWSGAGLQGWVIYQLPIFSAPQPQHLQVSRENLFSFGAFQSDTSVKTHVWILKYSGCSHSLNDRDVNAVSLQWRGCLFPDSALC